MSAARRTLDLAMSETLWQATVVDLAIMLGWTCLHHNDSRREVVNQSTGERKLVGDRDAAGLPDWLFLRERIVFAELKREQGKTTPQQDAVIAAIRRAGGEAWVWRPSDWPEVVLALRGRTRP